MCMKGIEWPSVSPSAINSADEVWCADAARVNATSVKLPISFHQLGTPTAQFVVSVLDRVFQQAKCPAQ